MEIKIDSEGYFLIKRGNNFKYQYCPFTAVTPHHTLSVCGDWCPLFGEPITGDDAKLIGWEGLVICNDKHFMGPVTDERPK